MLISKRGFSSMAIPLAIISTVFLISNQVAFSDDLTPIPPTAAGISAWFAENVKPLAARKGTMDPKVEAAEAEPVIINVGKDFPTLAAAVKSVKVGNTVRTIMVIPPGVHDVKINIEKGQDFITFYGAPGGKTTLVHGDTNLKVGTMYSATVSVYAEHFMAVNIEFKVKIFFILFIKIKIKS